MRPAELPTRETLTFVLQHLPSRPSRIVEVGCGNGELALRLQEAGHEVIALDSSSDAVEATKKLGVDARVVRWPEVDLESESVDVVLFTRSLHHIHPLPRAVDEARRVLRSEGLVLIEDFAFDELSLVTLRWFYDVLSVLNVSKKLCLERKNFATELMQEGPYIEIWHRNHDHDLSPWYAMLCALKSFFQPITETSVPYLYRHVGSLVEDNDAGYDIANHVLELEKRFGLMTPGRLVGRRFVGRGLSREQSCS